MVVVLESESHLSVCVDYSAIHNAKPKAVEKLGVYGCAGAYSDWNREFLRANMSQDFA